MQNKTNFMLTTLIALCTLFTSCENPIGNVLLRTYSDPFDQAPVVDSFSERKKIFISWDKDEGADEYILMRAEDAFSPQFEEIYRGRQLSYKDEKINEGTRYLYRLDKTRGVKFFKAKEYGYGYCSDRCRDSYDNHVIEKAVNLVYSIQDLNLYRGKFCDGTDFYEEDWFYVKVSAQCKKTIIVEQTNPIVSGSNPQQIDYLVGSDAYKNVGQNFSIKNEFMEDIYVPFKLMINVVPSSGVAIVNYTIRFGVEQPI